MKLDIEKQKEVWGKKSCLIQHDLGPVWSWDRIINEYDCTQFFSKRITELGHPRIGDVVINDLGNNGWALHGVSMHPDVREALTLLHTIDPTLMPKASMYLSFGRISSTFPEHRDPLHVWIHQYQGETDWWVEDGEYTLKPGDMLYIPPRFEHCAKITGPRCSMSWNLGPHEEDLNHFEHRRG
jgi:quercetin dioxygenase-like cupin family protein